jgi:acyl CoA:acetate/3-ketoacid CoA transferase alpha subunit
MNFYFEDVIKELIQKGNNDIYLVKNEKTNEDLILKVSFEKGKESNQNERIKVFYL